MGQPFNDEKSGMYAKESGLTVLGQISGTHAKECVLTDKGQKKRECMRNWLDRFGTKKSGMHAPERLNRFGTK